MDALLPQDIWYNVLDFLDYRDIRVFDLLTDSEGWVKKHIRRIVKYRLRGSKYVRIQNEFWSSTIIDLIFCLPINFVVYMHIEYFLYTFPTPFSKRVKQILKMISDYPRCYIIILDRVNPLNMNHINDFLTCQNVHSIYLKHSGTYDFQQFMKRYRLLWNLKITCSETLIFSRNNVSS